ncbi:hypothetical protein QT711_03060 [Sporosarcina saromensis]|uniref:Uncharacterized protein n=1 Tax=Sporosarcina saromensis TaxID=359365 RepID=A0ABU4G5C8_9BACL|nr:hypothetical protein [Sporosarcina saromensis]MDW0112149.1 hypothetical protein [Sporosarcina saromensis]
MKSREICPVSFNLKDEYERELFEFAKQPENGRFSLFIKRLIAEERSRREAPIIPQAPVQVMKVDHEDNKQAAKGFL